MRVPHALVARARLALELAQALVRLGRLALELLEARPAVAQDLARDVAPGELGRADRALNGRVLGRARGRRERVLDGEGDGLADEARAEEVARFEGPGLVVELV